MKYLILTLLLVSCAHKSNQSASLPERWPASSEVSDQISTPEQIMNPDVMEKLGRFSELINSDLVSKNCGPTGGDPELCAILNWAKYLGGKYKFCSEFFVSGSGEVQGLGKYVAIYIADEMKKNGTNSLIVKNFEDLIQPIDPEYMSYIEKGFAASKVKSLSLPANLEVVRESAKAVCPNYPKLSAFARLAFITQFFAALGYLESTCGKNTHNDDVDVPYGPAVCIYQLEYEVDLREWRSKSVKSNYCGVPKSEILKPEACTACAYDVFRQRIKANNTFFGHRNGLGKLVTPQYWHSLNYPMVKGYEDWMKGRGNPEISKMPFIQLRTYMSAFPLCHDKPANQ